MGHNTFIHNTTHSLRRCWWIRHLELADKERKWGKATQWRKEAKCWVRQRAGRKWQEKPKYQKGKKKQKSTYELGSQRRRWAETAVGNVLLLQLMFSNVSFLYWHIEQNIPKMCLTSSFSELLGASTHLNSWCGVVDIHIGLTSACMCVLNQAVSYSK